MSKIVKFGKNLICHKKLTENDINLKLGAV